MRALPTATELILAVRQRAGKPGPELPSDDLGSTLSLLDVTDNIVGGRVAVTGQVSDAAGKRVLRGHVDGENYNLVRAPVLCPDSVARRHSAAIGSMLAGSGIPFSTLARRFRL